MENAYYFIYVTVNDITEQKYLGQHCTFNPDDDYLGSGKYLIEDIKKYGIDNFKRYYIEECNDIFELANRELHWIKKFDCVKSNDWYNDTYICMPNKMFEYGRPDVVSSLTKQKQRNKKLGRKLSESHKKNISKAHLGVKKTKQHAKHIAKAKMGIKRSEECNKKISETLKGRHLTEEHKKNISEYWRKRRND